MAKRPEITARTRADIQEAFWQLYLERPIDTITVQTICDRAGYTRGTFYAHFHDRYEVLESVEASVLDSMCECVESCFKRIGKARTKVACLAGMAGVLAYYESNKAYIEKFLGTDDEPSFPIRLRDRLKPLWREYVVDESAVREEERSDEEIDLLLDYALSGAITMISNWLRGSSSVSAAELAHLVYDAAIKDVTARL